MENIALLSAKKKGVEIGNNPNQPCTDPIIENVIDAIRLVNVGDFGDAESLILTLALSEHQKRWLSKELEVVRNYLNN